MSWLDPTTKITPHFTVGEALYLREWGAYHRPSDPEKNAIRKTALVMERIRKYLGDKPITVTSWMRPSVADIPGHEKDGFDYNRFVKGSVGSAHRYGLACDFQVACMSADDVREALLPMLEDWDIRMEDLPGSNWVHIDLMPPRPFRYFKP